MDSIRPVTDQPFRAEKSHALGQYKALLRRRWVYPATIIPVGVLLALFVAYSLPATYRATGTILLEPSSIPKELITSTVKDLEDIPAYAEESLELVRRQVMVPEKMQEVVKEVDPYPTLTDLSVEEKAQRVVENVSVERVDALTLKPLDQSAAFSIHYNNPNPKLAAEIDSKIVQLYLTYNRTSRAEQAAAAYDFLQTQAKDVEKQMAGMEQQLAAFKNKNGNSLPEMQTHNLASLDRAQHDVETVQQEIVVAEEKEGQLQLQLNGLSPSMTNAVSDWRTQLAKLRSDLAAAEVKYTPSHPEIKRLRRAIADMAAQGSATLQPTSGQQPDNPDYLSVKSQLDAARNQLSTLRATEARARRDIASYEQSLATTPNVEREYTQLQRQYDDSRARYEDLQSRMKNAALARTMESEARGERFALLQAPKTPTRVYSPNRIGIVLLGLVLGSAIAFGCVAGVDAADPTIRGTADLQEIMETAALGAIPTLLTPKDVRRRYFRWGSAIAAFTAASVFVVATVILKHSGH
jgi:succinoglycan biosynthesis transport protein ExoP